MIEHFVLMKRKPNVTDSDMEPVMETIRQARGKVDGILEVTVGKNFSERAAGFTDAMLVRFANRAALEAYGPHPAHKEIIRQLDEVTEPRVVIDYEV